MVTPISSLNFFRRAFDLLRDGGAYQAGDKFKPGVQTGEITDGCSGTWPTHHSAWIWRFGCGPLRIKTGPSCQYALETSLRSHRSVALEKIRQFQIPTKGVC